LVLIDDGEQLRGVLKNSLEVISQVVKHRAVYLRDNVRIHLDDVAGLGTYIEFEAIVDENCDDATARLKIDFLLHAFGIEPETVASLSYGELIGS
jgi:predicted adenylyl cyclase CyaB